MNSFIEMLNLRGGQFLHFAWPMLWQSSLLIAFIFVVDFALRKRLRAAVRYALWMLVLVKLLLPAAFSLPTSVSHWAPIPDSMALNEAISPPWLEDVPTPTPIANVSTARLPQNAPAAPIPIPRPELTLPGFIFAAWLCVIFVLTALFLLRARQAGRLTAHAIPTDEFSELLTACARQMNLRSGSAHPSTAPASSLDSLAPCSGERARERGSSLRLKLSDTLPTPAVCGLLHPVILLPKSLVNKLDAAQIRAVLLHELAHVRRKDLWVSLLQTVLQIFYFYNPFLWLASAAIRRVREEAVDEMVLVALADEAEIYPETLVSVAKFSLQAPRLAFGFAGILESKSTLGARIRLMLHRPWPTSAKLGIPAAVVLLFLALVLLPLGSSNRLNPTYTDPREGVPKKAAQWWDQMDSVQMNLNDPKFSAGIDAFVHMGKDAVPFLRQQLTRKISGTAADDPAVVRPGMRGGPGNPQRALRGGRGSMPQDARDQLKTALNEQKAALILGYLGPVAAPAVPELIAIVQQNNPKAFASASAAMALERIGPKARAAVPALFDALQNGNDSAGAALVNIDAGNPKLLPALLDALQKFSGPPDPDYPNLDHSQLIRNIVAILPKFGPRAAAAIPVLRDMLQNTNGPMGNDYHYSTAQALKAIASDQPDIVAEANAVIQQSLHVGDIAELIAAAEKARGTDGYFDAFQKLEVDINNASAAGMPVSTNILQEQCLPLFSEALDSGNQKLIDAAVSRLGEFGTLAAPLLPKLVKIAEHDDPAHPLYGNAIGAMSAIAPGDPSILPILLRLLNDTNAPSWIHNNVCYALTYFGPEAKAAVPGLRQYLDTRELLTRFNATLALWRIAKEPPSTDILEQTLQKYENDYIANGVLDILSNLPSQTAETKSIIRQLAQYSSPAIQTNAQALLKKLQMN
jgi:beta-lactamase regulating signal transducer with metallopeptidase domain/HEAT repeat protein